VIKRPVILMIAIFASLQTACFFASDPTFDVSGVGDFGELTYATTLNYQQQTVSYLVGENITPNSAQPNGAVMS